MPLLKNGNPTLQSSPSALKAYFLATRPKTWIASLSPVLIGVSMAPKVDPLIFTLTLLFSLFIQIGTNFANDYFDFMKGTDNEHRIGPKRATQQGWIAPQSMLLATLLVFSAALLLAIPLMIQAGLWSLFLALACVAFGLLYTAGPKPIGYIGLGEFFVFIFFGPVAACGAYFLQTGSVTLPVLLASLPPALLSCAILTANNLRDEKGDRASGKKTLVVRFGTTFGKWEYTLLLLSVAFIPILLIPAAFLIRKAFKNENTTLLPLTGALLILYTICFCTLMLIR